MLLQRGSTRPFGANRCALVAAALITGSVSRSSRPSHQAGGWQHDARRCPPATWTEIPFSNDRGTVARFSTVLATGKSVFLFGDSLPFFTLSPAPLRPFVGRDVIRGGVIARPSEGDLFASPVAVANGERGATVIWGESPGTPVTIAAAWPPTTTHLWAARFDGDHWSKPGQVFQADEIKWQKESIGRFTQSNGSSWVAAPYRLGTNSGVVIGRFHGDSVDLRQMSSRAPVGYAAIVVRASGQMLLAFVAPDLSVERDGNSVFVVTSSDGGTTWSTPTLVSRSGLHPATQVRAIVDGDGFVHLIWLQDTANKELVLRHVVSRDFGLGWSEAQDLNAGPSITLLRVAYEACGSIAAIFEARRAGESGLYQSLWDGAWTAPSRLFPELMATDPDLVAQTSGGLVLTALVRPAGDTGTAPLHSMVAQYRPE